MSVKLMGAVFELQVAPLDKLVLLAMADHARDDGSGCYPSIATLAKKTSLSRRGTQKVVRRLEATGLIADTGKISPYSTVEYVVTLGNGGEQRSLPLKAHRANAKPKRGEPRDTKGANGSAQEGERGSHEPSVTKSLTKIGTGRVSGGGCQDTENPTVNAAATLEHAFAAFNFETPFGHLDFQAVLVSRASERHNGNMVEVMEAVIQDCQLQHINVPRKFYAKKHALEELEQSSIPEARVGAYNPEREPADWCDEIRLYILRNAEKILKAVKRFPVLPSKELQHIAKSLKLRAKSLTQSSDQEQLESDLSLTEQQIRSLLALSLSPEENQDIQRSAVNNLPHSSLERLEPNRIATLTQQAIDKFLFKKFGIPRLSLFYMT